MHADFRAPLVGRHKELNLLLRRWQQAQFRKGQVVLVSGEPGIGKSRMIAALEERLSGGRYIKLKYFCLPHHRDSAARHAQ
jgi:predicted ATPase